MQRRTFRVACQFVKRPYLRSAFSTEAEPVIEVVERSPAAPGCGASRTKPKEKFFAIDDPMPGMQPSFILSVEVQLNQIISLSLR